MDLHNLLADVEQLSDRRINSRQSSAEVSRMFVEPEDSSSPWSVNPAPPASVPPPRERETAPEAPARAIPAMEATKLGSLDLVLDADFELTVELGQAGVKLKDLLELRAGDRFA